MKNLMMLVFAFAVLHTSSSGQFSVADDLKRAKDQFEKQVADLEADQAAKVKVARDRYLGSLASAEKKAEAAGKQDASRAIAAEKEVAATGLQMAAKGPPALPPELSSPRTSFVRELDRIIKAGAAQAKLLASGYLKTLTSLETRAGKDQTVRDQLGQEKTQAERIAHPAGGSPVIPFARRKNVVIQRRFFTRRRQWRSCRSAHARMSRSTPFFGFRKRVENATILEVATVGDLLLSL